MLIPNGLNVEKNDEIILIKTSQAILSNFAEI